MNLHNADFASFLIFYFLKNISRALGAEKKGFIIGEISSDLYRFFVCDI